MCYNSDMMMKRDIEKELKTAAEGFPVVLLCGPRQSGKSTIINHVFSNYKSISLEDPDILLWAKEDPRGFLRENGPRLILDEIQRAPQLLSYMQSIVDQKNEPGMYILSGSQNFSMMKNITQSLAGRVGILTLLPLSLHELSKAEAKTHLKINSDNLSKIIFKGSYPRLYNSKIKTSLFYSSYFSTYLERDVRGENNVGDLVRFTNFMKVCAARVGQQVNWADIARVADIDERTAKSWLSVLEASFIVRLVHPYYNNFDKRVSKSPKLYFCDTGLACHLLGISHSDDLYLHPYYGSLFENLIINEYVKLQYSFASIPNCYFWRENEVNEVDLIIEYATKLYGYEIKSSWTAREKHTSGLARFAKVSNTPTERLKVVYSGEQVTKLKGYSFIPISDISHEFKKFSR
ncbi:ATPase [Actinomycetota bacterium]|nr:ATPase [Actinomycetota bacterium]